MNTQAATERCEHCGAACPVTVKSAYEFAWRCEPCQSSWLKSWAHKHAAPEFGVAKQGSLFEEVA